MRISRTTLARFTRLAVLGVLCVLLGFAIGRIVTLKDADGVPASHFYADGELLDVTGDITYEEPADLEGLAKRLVALIRGEAFTVDQIDQIVQGLSDVFCGVRKNGMGIEYHEFKINQLTGG